METFLILAGIIISTVSIILFLTTNNILDNQGMWNKFVDECEQYLHSSIQQEDLYKAMTQSKNRAAIAFIIGIIIFISGILLGVI